LLQGASLVGVYGLGTLTFLILASPAAGWRACFAGLAAVGLAGVVGQQVMGSVDSANTGPMIRIVQPNVPQAEKFRLETRAGQLQKLIDLSRRDGFDKVAAVVWPETAAPFIVQPDSAGLAVLATAAPRGGLLLTGAPRAGADVNEGVWNSLLAIDADGTVVATYDKVHLVPFGEYIPYHKEWPPIGGLIGRGSFEKGDGFKTLTLRGLPAFSPLAGHWWLARHLAAGDDWPAAAGDAPWSRYTTLRLDTARDFYRKARFDWWALDAGESGKLSGLYCALIAVLASAGAWLWRRGRDRP